MIVLPQREPAAFRWEADVPESAKKSTGIDRSDVTWNLGMFHLRMSRG
jgi:hypothetical protein